MTFDIACRPLTREAWLGSFTRWDDRENAPFGGHWEKTLRKLEWELGHLGADRAIIELIGEDPHVPVKIRLDGWPYASERIAPPVVVSFPSDHGWLRYQVDKYEDWRQNVHAVALTLDRLRAVERYGTVSQAQQYKGFAALPASTGSVADPVQYVAELLAWTVQNVEKFPDVAIEQARKKAHPDVGGSHESFLVVQEAASLLGQS